MWLSEKRGGTAGAPAEVGAVTIGGESAAVYTDAEHRGLEVFSPGGYVWRPKAGDDVLVIKCGGSELCVAGAGNTGAPQGMAAGEVYITSDGGASVYLKNDGSIRLAGSVCIDGGLFLNGNAVG